MGNIAMGVCLLVIGLTFGNELGRSRFKTEADNWHKHYEDKMAMTISLDQQLKECKGQK